jgi:hypothetical protein
VSATTSAVDGRPAPGEFRRVLVAARVQLLPWLTRSGLEVGRLDVATAVLVPAAVVVVVAAGLLGLPVVFLAYCPLLVVAHWRTVTQVFPFALGIGITRRTFSLATALVAVVESVVLGGVYAVLAQIERATGGWGLGQRVVGVGGLSAVELFAVYPVLVLLCAAIGVVLGAVSVRGGPPALWTLAAVVVVLSGLLAGLGAGLGWWTAVAALLPGVPITVLLAGGPLLVAVLLGLIGFAVLRRAAP